MARDFYIAGEVMVKVKGMVGTAIEELQELGLSDAAIRVIPKYVHRDVFVDDYGKNVPAETHWMLAEATIQMTLVNYDDDILDACVAESACGGTAGTMIGAGTPMGGFAQRFQDGCHYIGLNLIALRNRSYRFLTTYLTGPPVEYPFGTERSVVRLNWRAIPYPITSDVQGELVSTGIVLYDNSPDT